MAIERTGKAAELFEKAKNLYKKDDNAGAVAMFSEVINLLPNDADSIHLRSMAYKNLGNLEKAAADIEKMLELRPELRGTEYFLLAQTYEKNGNKNKAIEYYQKSVEGGDFDGEAQKALARLGAASGNMNTGNVEFR